MNKKNTKISEFEKILRKKLEQEHDKNLETFEKKILKKYYPDFYNEYIRQKNINKYRDLFTKKPYVWLPKL